MFGHPRRLGIRISTMAESDGTEESLQRAVSQPLGQRLSPEMLVLLAAIDRAQRDQDKLADISPK